MSTAPPPPAYVPVQQQPQPGYAPQQSYVPMYQGMPAQPQPFAPQGQPMMYAAQPVSGPVDGAVYAAQSVGGVYAQPVAPGAEHIVLVNGGAQAPHYVGFSDGIFDCFDDATSCLLACCITPVRWSMTVDRAGLFRLIYALVAYGGAYWGMVVLNSVYNQIMCTDRLEVCANVPSWAPTVLAIFMIICWIIQLALGTVYRGKIRDQHGIQGSACEDCCLHLWCNCCAVAQEARHVDRMTGHIPHNFRQFHN